MKAHSNYQWIPVFFMACSAACYVLSKHVMPGYTEWFHWFAMKNFECPTVVIIGLWCASLKMKWSIMSRLCLVHISILAIADNFYLFTESLQCFDTGFFVSNCILIFMYSLLTVMGKLKKD